MNLRPPIFFWVVTSLFFSAGCVETFAAPGSSQDSDECPDDPQKSQPGICGCGVPDDHDDDGDGVVDCLDGCPRDPLKKKPGHCGCGVIEVDGDGDGTSDCIDDCPGNPQKTAPGICGCGATEIDRDGDGTPDCIDDCPDNPQKTAPGMCGCLFPEETPCKSMDALADAFGLPTGLVEFELSTGKLPLYIDGDYDSGGWVLIGRGREGWAWTEDGAGDPAFLADGLETPAAFSPIYLPTATIQELIDNSDIDLRQVDIRIKRAASSNGTLYQEVLWRSEDKTDWTWLFDSNSYIVSYDIEDSALGTGQSGLSDTRDNMGPNDQNRVFTWAWADHDNKKGFSYGSAISGGTDGPENFFWQAGGENHAIPYSEVYLRYSPLHDD